MRRPSGRAAPGADLLHSGLVAERPGYKIDIITIYAADPARSTVRTMLVCSVPNTASLASSPSGVEHSRLHQEQQVYRTFDLHGLDTCRLDGARHLSGVLVRLGLITGFVQVTAASRLLRNEEQRRGAAGIFKARRSTSHVPEIVTGMGIELGKLLDIAQRRQRRCSVPRSLDCMGRRWPPSCLAKCWTF